MEQSLRALIIGFCISGILAMEFCIIAVFYTAISFISVDN